MPATVASVIDSFETLQWGKVAERLREIQASLRADSDADISIKSLVTLRQTLRRVARVPDPRIGSGESGILEAVWALARRPTPDGGRHKEITGRQAMSLPPRGSSAATKSGFMRFSSLRFC